MASYVFDEFGYFKEVFEDYLNGIEVKHPRSVDFAPAFIPDYPRENGKPWFKLDVHMTKWVLEVYQAPTEEIKAKNVVSKSEFARLFGAVKFAEILQATQNNIEVKAGYEYAGLCDVIELNHPDTALYLGILAKNGLLTADDIQKISNNQPIW